LLAWNSKAGIVKGSKDFRSEVACCLEREDLKPIQLDLEGMTYS
jgi:hypothetical protein